MPHEAERSLERARHPRPDRTHDRRHRQSKLANAVFGCELHRRLAAAGSPVRSVLAHPGYAATGLQHDGPTGLWRFLLGALGNRVLAQAPERGALPLLYAAAHPSVESGQFIGPDGPAELRGGPALVTPAPAATDRETGRRLWDLSERLTGVRFPLPAPARNTGRP
ncbi:short-chain dehydrogenase [Streptomyces sp. RFCAC02]|uniref:short-chain dehydrogenase n=1 Tax=Streptomyces sp. RFCAC02 TaxID=2499143 RepID=UPI003209A180